MKDFFITLYSNEKFPLYLGIIIIVLIIAFIVIYFLGKKDKKKIEETQKLQVINEQNNNAFKVEETATPVEVNINQTNPNLSIQPQQVIENQVVTQPVIEQQIVRPTQVIEPPIVQQTEIQQPVIESPVIDNAVVNDQVIMQPVVNEPVQEIPTQIVDIPVSNPVETPVIQETVNKPLEPVMDENSYSAVTFERDEPVQPVLKNEPESNFYFNTQAADNREQPQTSLFNPDPVIEPVLQTDNDPLKHLSDLTNSIEQELNSLESKKININNQLPEPESNTKVVNNIFSSVYVPPKENINEEDEIELPKLKY